jgi:uncharacterized RDD family membrane protein YckC
MMDEKRDHPAGVYYALKDYAGLGRRLFVLAIDGLVVYIGYLVSWMAFGWGWLGDAGLYAWALGFAAFCYLYLAVLARSRFGTLGYTVASVQVVDLTGMRPSLACMSFRTAFAVLGPINALLDVIWLGGDSHRQALRDKLAGTYIIRKGAAPGGEGPQAHVFIWFLGYGLMVREVGRRGT